MTVVEQLAEVMAAQSALQATINEHVAALAERDERIVGLAAQMDGIAKAHADELAQRDVLMSEAAAQVQAVIGERDAALAERDDARKALKNPAFATAAVRGDETPAPEGAAPAPENVVGLVDQMAAIRDPKERAAFYHANKDAIKAEIGR